MVMPRRAGWCAGFHPPKELGLTRRVAIAPRPTECFAPGSEVARRRAEPG